MNHHDGFVRAIVDIDDHLPDEDSGQSLPGVRLNVRRVPRGGKVVGQRHQRRAVDTRMRIGSSLPISDPGQQRAPASTGFMLRPFLHMRIVRKHSLMFFKLVPTPRWNRK